MFETTNALALRITPFSNTSQVVTWLTEWNGKLVTVCKGALRPRSVFLGQYDMGYTCELVYYSRERNGMHIAKECSPLNTRPGIRKNWRAAVFVSYVCDVLSRAATHGNQDNRLYALAGKCLDFINENGVKPQLLFWFELQLLETLGLAPLLLACSKCSARMDSVANMHFSWPQGGILCSKCASPEETDKNNDFAGGRFKSVRIKPDVLAVMRNWQASNNPYSAFNTVCSPEQIAVFFYLFGNFIQFHLDFPCASRDIVTQLFAA